MNTSQKHNKNRRTDPDLDETTVYMFVSPLRPDPAETMRGTQPRQLYVVNTASVVCENIDYRIRISF
jgi:hypothetical protein